MPAFRPRLNALFHYEETEQDRDAGEAQYDVLRVLIHARQGGDCRASRGNYRSGGCLDRLGLCSLRALWFLLRGLRQRHAGQPLLNPEAGSGFGGQPVVTDHVVVLYVELFL